MKTTASLKPVRDRVIRLSVLESMRTDAPKRLHILHELEAVATEALNATVLVGGMPTPRPDYGAAIEAIAHAARVSGLDSGGTIAHMRKEQADLLANMRAMAEQMRKNLQKLELLARGGSKV